MAQARTAVVVVHGIGNQRPLATVRAIVSALYTFAGRRPGDEPIELWTKLDRGGGDLDLPVITTANLAQDDGPPRPVDFHECYWAPLMAELRFLAVPLWLFELVRKGPGALSPALRGLWYGTGALLALWSLATALLSLQGLISMLTILPVQWFIASLSAIIAAGLAALWFRRWMLGLALLGLAAALCWPWTMFPPAWFKIWSNVLLPWTLAAGLTYVLMGPRGLMLLGGVIGALMLGWLAWGLLKGGYTALPMTLGNRYNESLFWASLALLLFVAMNWFFLLTVAGDAARYLRGAPSNIMVRRQIRSMGVDLLRQLHAAQWDNKPRYDRIIIVSHSLGTIVAYDMLRAYWSEVAPTLGDPHAVAGGKEQDETSSPLVTPWTDADRAGWRARARTLLGSLDTAMLAEPDCFAEPRARRWIVSDFITLGSPLTHAEYLMAEGPDAASLRDNLELKRVQREFPTSPSHLSSDGMLSFTRVGRRRFHHGALFGLTRWNNLYFPVRRLFWGDLVGGPLQSLFGQGIVDVAVSGAPNDDLLAHTHYWDSAKDTPPTAALTALRDAVNLRAAQDS